MFMSAIVLGGFVVPSIMPTAVQAQPINKPADSKIISKNSLKDKSNSNSGTIHKLTEPIDLQSLKVGDQVEMPADAEFFDKDKNAKIIDLGFGKSEGLTASQISDLKNGKRIRIDGEKITKTSPSGRDIIFIHDNSDYLRYNNQTKALELEGDSGILRYRIDGYTLLVHFVKEDTKEEFATEKIFVRPNDADSGEFNIPSVDKTNKYPIGYFDTEDYLILDPEDSLNGDDLTYFDTKEKTDYFDPSDFSDKNSERTYYLKKSEKFNGHVNIYLDGKLYDSKNGKYSTFEKYRSNEQNKLPDADLASVDKSKTQLTIDWSYNPESRIFAGGELIYNKFQALIDNNEHVAQNGGIDDSSYLNIINTEYGGHTYLHPEFAGRKITLDIYYKSKNAVTGNVIIKSNLGDQIVRDVYGKKGDTITIDVPQVYGYISDKKTVKAKVTDDGQIITDEFVTYTKVNEDSQKVSADVEIESNLGKVTVKDVEGHVGDTVVVAVPELPGYKANKATVKAKVNKDGSITTDEKVEYTKISTTDPAPSPAPNPSPSPNPDPEPNPDPSPLPAPQFPVPEDFDGFLGTHKKNVPLYSINDGVAKLGNRSLAAHSDWASDQKINIDGQTYYRVSTNEWCKISDVYRYESTNGVITTQDSGDFTSLVDSNNSAIKHRSLGKSTSWKYDRIAYLGDKEKPHYRVSTNEFILTSHIQNYR